MGHKKREHILFDRMDRIKQNINKRDFNQRYLPGSHNRQIFGSHKSLECISKTDMNRIIETPRLYLRELTEEDSENLLSILSDPETMRYYPAPFSKQKVNEWIIWNRESYDSNGYGLWAVILKEGGIFLGDCGITLQDIEGRLVPELGYHIKKESWNCGFATEAAKACMDYAFNSLGISEIFSYSRKENLPSQRVAEKIGMEYQREFRKIVMGENVVEVLYRIEYRG